MKTLICNKPFNMSYEERPKPTPAADEALLKIRTIGICGTDIHAYTGKQPFFNYPRVLGHEICGVVEELGASCADVEAGDRVVVMPVTYCGECVACKAGKTNCCESASLYGVHQDGGFSEYLAVKEQNLLKVPEGLSDVAAAYIEPFTISAHAVRRGNVGEGDAVLVVGAGPIGIGVAAVAKAKGARVVVADVRQSRLDHIKDCLGVAVVDASQEDYEGNLKTAFGGELPGVVFDVTGSKPAMSNAVNIMAAGGTLVFVGLYIGDLQIDDPTFHRKETTLLSSRNSTIEDFHYVISLLESGALHERFLHNRTYDFDSIGHSYEQDVVGDDELIKGIIQFK